MSELTHWDDQGRARMVDVGHKDETERLATAIGRVSMAAETLRLISAGSHRKGDVLGVARLAGIQAAKRCAELIPLCHTLMLTSVEVDFELEQSGGESADGEHVAAVLITATCRLRGRTGVEMEALTAVAVAGLTIYDMCKAADGSMRLSDIVLIAKEGGRSGTMRRAGTRLTE